mgnify:CR=1 FL=1
MLGDETGGQLHADLDRKRPGKRGQRNGSRRRDEGGAAVVLRAGNAGIAVLLVAAIVGMDRLALQCGRGVLHGHRRDGAEGHQEHEHDQQGALEAAHQGES